MTKTLSTQAPAALAARIDHLAQAEGRNRSQVVIAALEFWAQLSPEAHFAIGRIQAMSEELRVCLARQVERDVLDVQFAALRDRIVTSLTVPDDLARQLDADADDDAFLDAAVAAVAAEQAEDRGPARMAR